MIAALSSRGVLPPGPGLRAIASGTWRLFLDEKMITAPKPLRDPITITVQEARRLSGLGLTSVYKLIGDGRLRVVKVRGRTLVRYESLKSLLEMEP